MASTSARGEYIDISLADGGCDDNQPLSACYAYDLVSNARHLRDESTQYRVNWIGGADWDGNNYDYVEVTGTTATYQHAITHIFPWQMTPDEKGPRTPVIRVLGASEATTATFSLNAFVMPFNHGTQNYFDDVSVYLNGYSYFWEGTSTTEVIAEMIASAGDDRTADTKMIMDTGVNAYSIWHTWDLDNTSTTQKYYTGCYLYKLSIWALGSGRIYGVSLREYAE